MANANMKVQTGEVTAAKNQIASKASDLKTAYQKVFSDLEKINEAWDGDDNNEFNDRKASFQKDFQELDVFLESLDRYLKKVVDDYNKAENDTKQAAQRLAK